MTQLPINVEAVKPATPTEWQNVKLRPLTTQELLAKHGIKPIPKQLTEAEKAKAQAELLKKKTPTNAYYVNGKLVYGGPR